MGWSDFLNSFRASTVQYTHLSNDESGGIEMTEPHETVAVQ